MSNKLSDWLVEKSQKRNQSLRSMSLSAGLSHGAFDVVVNHRRHVGDKTLYAISHYFGVPFSHIKALYEGEELPDQTQLEYYQELGPLLSEEQLGLVIKMIEMVLDTTPRLPTPE